MLLLLIGMVAKTTKCDPRCKNKKIKQIPRALKYIKFYLFKDISYEHD